MLRNRIIPTLLLYDNGLYKTVNYNLKKGKYVGDPVNAIKIFNDKGVDELIFLDIVASKNKVDPNYSLIEKIASECFMPFAYGGGIKKIEQIRKIFAIGVEKVILNSVLIEGQDLLREAASIFGSQSIIASVDIKKDFWGKYRVYDSLNKKMTKLDPLEYIHKLIEEGAGELYITCVDREGTMSGFDVDFIKTVVGECRVPVVANGGAGSVEDIVKAIKETNVSAVSAGSIFVFQGPHKAVLITYPRYDEIEKMLKVE